MVTGLCPGKKQYRSLRFLVHTNLEVVTLPGRMAGGLQQQRQQQSLYFPY